MSTAIKSSPECLVCDSELALDGSTEKGEIVECVTCGQEHEVTDISASGVELALAPEIEEDWGE
ncbi:hypothetical protein [Actinopolyspora mortivallis]|uniref:hypothetical protein n=1 Tax=Actinopolyspora mortivallis TaxID=33906 RepID=UPI00037F1AF0|nr:hypothetical protein [Actinopolyspora mortivallis]